MVVPVIDQNGIRTVECERDPPIAAHGYRVVPGQLAMQPVEAPAGQVHIARLAGSVQVLQLQAQPLDVLGPDASLGAGLEECLKSGMAERADHGLYRIAAVYDSQFSPAGGGVRETVMRLCARRSTERHHVCPGAQRIQIIGPTLHHGPPLGQAGRAVVDRPHR